MFYKLWVLLNIALSLLTTLSSSIGHIGSGPSALQKHFPCSARICGHGPWWGEQPDCRKTWSPGCLFPVSGRPPSFFIPSSSHVYVHIIIPIPDNQTTIDIITLSNRPCNSHLTGEGPKLEVAELGLEPGRPPRLGVL